MVMEDDTVPERSILAYILADKYLMPDLQNAIIDMLKNYWAVNLMYPEHVALAIEQAGEDSKIVQFVLDQLAWELANNEHEYCLNVPSNSNEANKMRRAVGLDELLTRGNCASKLLWLTKHTSMGTQTPQPAETNCCRYHVHQLGENCTGKKR